MTFYENSLNVPPLHDISMLSIEIVIEISSLFITEFNLYIRCMYRPPKGCFYLFLEVLAQGLDKIYLSKKVVFAGDFYVHFQTANTD